MPKFLILDWQSLDLIKLEDMFPLEYWEHKDMLPLSKNLKILAA